MRLLLFSVVLAHCLLQPTTLGKGRGKGWGAGARVIFTLALFFRRSLVAIHPEAAQASNRDRGTGAQGHTDRDREGERERLRQRLRDKGEPTMRLLLFSVFLAHCRLQPTTLDKGRGRGGVLGRE